MRAVRLASAGLSLVLAASVTASAQSQAAPAAARSSATLDTAAARGYARAIIADGRRIAAPNGVEELMEIPIGETRQWISIRGKDRANPILLMIHGGPASPEMPTGWAFQTGWEDYFTVVQWDQRGSGKTYAANDPATVAPTLTLDRIVRDGVEVIDFLRARYHQDRVIVLGHSWGSIVGLELARRRPDLLHAYVGMGQIVDGQANERVSYERTLRAAEAAGNARAVRELRSIAPYPERDGSLPLEKIGIERKWSNEFGGLLAGRSTIGGYLNLAELSPDYTDAELAAIDRGSAHSLPRLLPELGRFSVANVARMECPIIIFAGRHDTTTPAEPVAEWMARVQAPSKQWIWFENSAHMMMFEEPGRVLVHLVQDVLPLAHGRESAPQPIRR